MTDKDWKKYQYLQFVKRWQSMFNLVLKIDRSEDTLHVPQSMLAWDIPGKVAKSLNLHITIKTYHVMNTTFDN